MVISVDDLARRLLGIMLGEGGCRRKGDQIELRPDKPLHMSIKSKNLI